MADLLRSRLDLELQSETSARVVMDRRNVRRFNKELFIRKAE